MKVGMVIGTAVTMALVGCTTASPPAGNANDVAETHWKLVELNGKPVPELDREPYLILKAKGGRAEGFGGCNSFGGIYQIDEKASRVRFDQINSTLMACPSGMEVEGAFMDALRSADSYSLDGDRLSLNRARMAPLARFEAVHLH